MRYDPTAVATVVAALGRPADAHDFALSDASTGRILGVYVSEQAAALAAAGALRHPGVFVVTVLHPEGCGCWEMAQ